MSGDWLAMGAVAALAAAGVASRRGSRSTGTPIGYHCSHRELRSGFHGGISRGYGGRAREIVGALPFTYADRLHDLGIDPHGYGVEDTEEWGEQVNEALNRMGVRWIFIAENPLSDTGGYARSSFGDWCYLVTLPDEALLGAFVDDNVATGGGDAFAVLYDENLGSPVLELVEEQAEVQAIEFPHEAMA